MAKIFKVHIQIALQSIDPGVICCYYSQTLSASYNSPKCHYAGVPCYVTF
jgi:hypothetical protein